MLTSVWPHFHSDVLVPSVSVNALTVQRVCPDPDVGSSSDEILQQKKNGPFKKCWRTLSDGPSLRGLEHDIILHGVEPVHVAKKNSGAKGTGAAGSNKMSVVKAGLWNISPYRAFQDNASALISQERSQKYRVNSPSVWFMRLKPKSLQSFFNLKCSFLLGALFPNRLWQHTETWIYS